MNRRPPIRPERATPRALAACQEPPLPSWGRITGLALLNVPLWALLHASLYAGDAKHLTMMWCGIALVAAAGIAVFVCQARFAGRSARQVLRSSPACPPKWVSLLLVTIVSMVLNPTLFVLSAVLVTVL